MGQMTSDELSRFFREGPVESLRIEGIVETEDTKYLGAVGLSLRQPLFSSILGFNFSGVLSDSARFWLQPISAASEGRDGVAAIFRQFDSSKYQSSPEDLLAGWVRPEDAAKLEAWVAEMNRHLKDLLQLKHRRCPAPVES
jgi:hypothetical protein